MNRPKKGLGSIFNVWGCIIQDHRPAGQGKHSKGWMPKKSKDAKRRWRSRNEKS